MKGFKRFLDLSEQDRRDVFDVAAERLGTLPSYIEKDFWVCHVLDLLYNHLPKDCPRLLFKGGTSLSKVFDCIQRFSEDIDLVVYREDLGFPINHGDLSNKKRKKDTEDLIRACGSYISGDLRKSLEGLLGPECSVHVDPDSSETLLVEYETLYPGKGVSYVQPRVKLEAGARSALDPNILEQASPYIATELPDWSFKVANLRVIRPERTYLEKLLILHGLHCRYRDEKHLPKDKDRLSRHYYDVAMMTLTSVGKTALSDAALLKDVREHNIKFFNQTWKRFEEAVPGTIQVVPQSELRSSIQGDYNKMRDMVLGEAPSFDWIMEQIAHAEGVINKT